MRVEMYFQALDARHLAVTIEGDDPPLIDELIQKVRETILKDHTKEKWEEV